jgi:hypothetical protein
VDVADRWYDDQEFLTLRRDYYLENLHAVRVTKATLSKVVSEAKKLGEKANELNRTGAPHRHLAVIARWYEGDRWLAIHEFLFAQGRRPEWVPLYEGAGLTAKQISRATRLRRAFPTVDDLKKIATLEEAEALVASVLSKKKRNESGATTDNKSDTGAGADSTVKAPPAGTGKAAPDAGQADAQKADKKKPRKRRSKGTSGTSGDGGATLPPDPVEALERDFKLQYTPGNLLEMGVKMIERGLGRAAVDDKPFRMDTVLDDLATVALAAADKKVRDIDKEGDRHASRLLRHEVVAPRWRSNWRGRPPPRCARRR